MYRLTQIRTVVADDSNLNQVDYDRTCVVNQVKDQQVFHTVVRVAVGASQAQVPIAPVTAGYFYEIRSDYPIMFRINGASATQFTMTPCNVQPVNVGAPLPDQCYASGTCLVSSIYVQPITGATQTANVRVVVTGDPSFAYA